MECLYRIPFCGGFCAPTVSPEPTCFKHVSNEYTIPAGPCYMKCPGVIESNLCCIACGKIGPSSADRNRKSIQMCGFFLNFVALILTIVALIGFSSDVDTLRSVSWVTGEATALHGKIDLYVGVVMRYDRVDCSSWSSTSDCEFAMSSLGLLRQAESIFTRKMKWDDDAACTGKNAHGNEQSLLSMAERARVSALCQDCKDNTYSLTTLVLAVVTYLPTIGTNLQRTTRFGDVNCQKTMGVVSNIFGFITSFSSLMSFHSACYANLPSELETSHGTFPIDWSLGPGWICLCIAVCIKILDGCVHLIVPTPSQRWVKPDKNMTDVIDYLKQAPVQMSQDQPEIGEVIGANSS